MSELFKFELSSHSSSLFDKTGMPREAAHKSNLADAIWTLGECGIDALPVDTKYVLDGGSLILNLPWPSKSTFGDICKMYSCNLHTAVLVLLQHLRRHQPRLSIIVCFDP